MKKVVKRISVNLLAAAFVLALGFSGTTFAAPDTTTTPTTTTGNGLTVTGGASAAQGTEVPTELTGTTGVITSIVNLLLFVAGAVAVVMIIIGGIRYVTSNGDQAHVKAAKDTIMYSIIGLVVAILAYAIVGFVTTNVK